MGQKSQNKQTDIENYKAPLSPAGINKMESFHFISMFIAFVQKNTQYKAIITVKIVLQITTKIENVWEGNNKLKKTKLILHIQKND